ncbi:Ssk2-type MAP kinase [Aulographum hederae CBS 113979]|uniref:MAP kinase kinase kinase n=1 Tax=Aulographum hederae CBS 113979 TaxID=1176131 RepID=A0A6G1GK73_9PEZI|nr:Ssk2-type MAP kinase [Aulographum hederae CBS 113979]
MDSPDLVRNDSSGSSSGSDTEGQFNFTPAVVATPLVDHVPDMPDMAGFAGWGANPTVRTRGSDPASSISPPQIQTNGNMNSGRPKGMIRTPSNAYTPSNARRPQYSLSNQSSASNRPRNSSVNRRRNPNAEYRAQEKAYVQRIRQDVPEYEETYNELRTPSLGYSSDSDLDAESPSTGEILENDPYDQETLLYYGNDDMQPSVEELKIPENRERLEWHSMLASVLTGDVVKQEKKRLIGGGEQQADSAVKAEMWMQLRAKVTGRAIQVQRKILDDSRLKAKTEIEAIMTFEIKGEAEVGKTPLQQVEDVVQKIEKCESLYPNRKAMDENLPRAASPAYKDTCDAVIAWYNTTQLINTELEILKKWVGNDDLDFMRPWTRDGNDSSLAEEMSFLERLLKEDGLKSLQGDDSLLVALDTVIHKAKVTFIQNAPAFAIRHLPPYIEELQTLINFPSRLVHAIIRMRLSYAKKSRDQTQQGVFMTEQMITQFQILLRLAVRIREQYDEISQPQNGWDPPDCIEENFDSVVLDALNYYFKMLNWKLSANKNTFKEAEILEQEWEFSNKIGRHLTGGDVAVAEQFSLLTSKSLTRLTNHFEKELQRRPDELGGAEMEKRYKQILDSVRVRQRKLFRFSRILTQRFENCTEFNINIPQDQLMEFYDTLVFSGHFLLDNPAVESSGLFFIASPMLQDRPKDVESLLGTCYHAEDAPEDSSNPYVLILKPEIPLAWAGRKVEMTFRQPHLDIKTGRLRLVADGSLQRLANAKLSFQQAIGMELTVLSEQRANLFRVNQELQRIKRTAYKLSNTIMDSVEIIRKQTDGLECQELIQTCFAFATEFGQRSLLYLDFNRRALNNLKLSRLALDWVAFICDDCVASDRKTFRWAVVALEFAMVMTRGQNILSISEEEYAKLRSKVGGCMSLLISHFDIMGARSTMAAQAEKQRMDTLLGKHRPDVSRLMSDAQSEDAERQRIVEQLNEIDDVRKQKEAERQALGRVLEDSNEADRALTYLSSSATNVTLRWQQGQFVGGGTFGSVYAALNLDSGQMMAVKEIRLQDPQLIPTIVSQIRDEMGVLQVLDHPNIVQYYGIEPHRDKVYIFMEYCSGGSLAGLLEHGRIEDEMVIMVYALQMLEGLGYLHERHVVHRDVKPENILLSEDGVIKFVDFGAAKVIARQGKTLADAVRHAAPRQNNANPNQNANGGGRQNSMQGTPMYMSPEVIKGEDTGRLGAVDIWSLGCVILEMATGRRPWATLDNEWAIMYNIAQGNQPQLPSKEQLSDQGFDFLRRCFEKDPNKRASAAELLQCEWMVGLRNQLSLEVGTPVTPSESGGSGSAGGSAGNSTHGSRQNSGYAF